VSVCPLFHSENSGYPPKRKFCHHLLLLNLKEDILEMSQSSFVNTMEVKGLQSYLILKFFKLSSFMFHKRSHVGLEQHGGSK